MTPRVSVIIPFYKGIEWLCEAVESVLAQTFDNFELIVVNDGSPENMLPFIERYGDKIIYLSQENQGPAVARNYGMSVATGDYFAFEDADDIWLPTKLEKQIGFMEKGDFVWSHTGYYNWWPDSGRQVVVNNYHDYDDMSKQIKVSCRIATPTIVVKRSALEEHPDIRFATNLRVGEDTALYSQLSCLYGLALVQEPLVKVRMRGDKSYRDVLRRFEHRAIDYEINKDTMTPLMRFNGRLYVILHKIFGLKRNKVNEFFAKCCMVLPYGVERVYIKWLVWTSKKDKKYILRWSDTDNS